jgi:hypothetical protein
MRLNGRESLAKPWSDRFLVRRAQHTIREQETADGYESANATSAGHCFGNAAISIATWAMRRGPIIVGNLFASSGGWNSRSVLASPRGPARDVAMRSPVFHDLSADMAPRWTARCGCKRHDTADDPVVSDDIIVLFVASAGTRRSVMSRIGSGDHVAKATP